MQFFELLKQVSVSNRFAFAVFGASAAFLIGPDFFPHYIPVTIPLWRSVAATVMVFSGLYLAIWLLQLFWHLSVKTKRGVGFWWHSKHLTPQDKFILRLVSSQSYATLNISNISEIPGGLTKLELAQYAKGLQRTGLVELGEYDEYCVYLTERGKQRVVLLLKEWRALDNRHNPVNESL